jgi:hypothetical protein
MTVTDAAGRPLLVRNGRLLDVVTGTYAEGDLLAVDGRIAETGPGVTAPADAELRDLRGGFVLPGLMTRMCTSRPSPRIWGRWDPCPLPNDLARPDALSWSWAIFNGKCV